MSFLRKFRPVSDECFCAAVDRLIKEGKGDDLLLVLRLGADINGTLRYMSEWALHLAIERDCKALLRRLVSFGVDVNVKRSNGWTVLMSACERCDLETVGMLLRGGAKVNEKTKDDWTALMSACCCGDVKTVDLLLCWGADVNNHFWQMRRLHESSDWGDLVTPLSLASKGGHHLVVRRLLDEDSVAYYSVGLAHALVQACIGSHHKTGVIQKRSTRRSCGSNGSLHRPTRLREVVRLLLRAQEKCDYEWRASPHALSSRVKALEWAWGVRHVQLCKILLEAISQKRVQEVTYLKRDTRTRNWDLHPKDRDLRSQIHPDGRCRLSVQFSTTEVIWSKFRGFRAEVPLLFEGGQMVFPFRFIVSFLQLVQRPEQRFNSRKYSGRHEPLLIWSQHGHEIYLSSSGRKTAQGEATRELLFFLGVSESDGGNKTESGKKENGSTDSQKRLPKEDLGKKPNRGSPCKKAQGSSGEKRRKDKQKRSQRKSARRQLRACD
uniref:Uncharacterized protein n=1 Tax=Chromera velia CCMP2878 TaxID=1169474 RepID=A0A0G4FT28_9ALVE|eukprot:Cvel_18598.t1-p1 / transcript=Cvel_18598.t1 / gene=Cvel_18598 / organism=Chromera_velia_CCMP2878 / gene_product=Putative ankyrin repeat protein L93, putative / transcript_product=Putative ankyrin repeat protein L93, putative / location=Cvel_scaffold1551:39798-41273(+) / protein_length=492 / sequence_SO=supercontig / SO=protein_coding / is_pseudo=false